MRHIDLLYKNALKEILETGDEIEDKRLFHKDQAQNRSTVKVVPGMLFKIDLEKDGFPLISLRKIPTKLFVAESIWFLLADNKTEPFLKQFTKIWDDFTEEDGTVTSYGHRWRQHFGRDQLMGALEMLQKDPSSRHGVVGTWDPATDSLTNGIKRKNVPCQVNFIINITNGRLNFHSIWRSVDMILGFPHDVAGNALLTHILAAYLGVKPGYYFHYIANAHIYGNQYEKAKELLDIETDQKDIMIEAKEDWFTRGENGDTSLVTEINDIIAKQYTSKGIKFSVQIVV